MGGVKPRQFRWVILLCAATILSLESKEVGFMYIGIFGLVLTLYWLLQVAQGIRRGETPPIIGWILGGVIGVGVLIGLSVALGSVTARVLEGRLPFSATIWTVLYLLLLGLVSLVFLRPVRAALSEVGAHARSVFQLVIAGVILGTIGALGMTCILSIANASSGIAADVVQSHEIRWIIGLVSFLLILLVGTALLRFMRSRWTAAILVLVLVGLTLVALSDLSLVLRIALLLALLAAGGFLLGGEGSIRLPWSDLLLIILVAVVTCIALTLFEERSRNIVNDTSTQAIQNLWIFGSWIVGALAIGGISFFPVSPPPLPPIKPPPPSSFLLILLPSLF